MFKIFKKSFLLPIRGNITEEVQLPHSAKDILVGTWHTPEEFVKKAQNVVHPMDECALNQITKDAIKFVSKSDPKLVSIERRKNLLKAKILAKQLEGDETSLHKNLPKSVEKVVSDKKILLWKTLLEQNGYDDMEVVKFMTQGVPLVGAHDHPPCYPFKPKLASMTEAELRSSAAICRLALESRRPDGCRWFCRASRINGHGRGRSTFLGRPILLRCQGGIEHLWPPELEDHETVRDRARGQAQANR